MLASMFITWNTFQFILKLRRKMKSLSTILAVIFTLSSITGFDGARIVRLDVPLAIRNNSGPIELVCVYNISENENGLVVKWYHGNKQIYQWIPPMKPRDLGIFANLTSYTLDTVNRPQSHSIIHVKEAHLDMSGEYTCSVATFVSDDTSEVKKMIVYVPEHSLTVQVSNYNETHLNLECLAIGAFPLPDLTIIIESFVPNDCTVLVEGTYPKKPRKSLNSIVEKPTKPVLVECEIQIPETGYVRREKLVYYPIEENSVSVI